LKKFWTFFKEKVWPWLRLLPRAILLGIVTAFVYDYFVSGSFKFYIYIIGVLLAIPGFYLIIILSRAIRRWEYKEEPAELPAKK
jgi:membrane protein YdbS with pleckstrin-like domain